MPRELAGYSTETLLHTLLTLTRREQWRVDPLRFAREVFPQHFSRAPAPMHRRILAAMSGLTEAQADGGGRAGEGVDAAAAEVGELPIPISISLPYPSPLSDAELNAPPPLIIKECASMP